MALNAQEPAPLGGEHGTLVASVIGAPLNGVGLVGIYPRAVLRSWDAAKGDGHATRVERDRRRHPRRGAGRASVINLSLGADTRDLAIELAVSEAVATGLARRRGLRERRRPREPARVPGGAPARDRRSPRPTARAASPPSRAVRRTSTSPRPGDDILVASALGKNWRPTLRDELLLAARRRRRGVGLDGRARSSTAGQVAEVLRRSARDIGAAGPRRRGGLRDAQRRRGARARRADPRPARAERRRRRGRSERRPYVSKAPPLTTSTRRSRAIAGRVDAYEDPRDVFRVWLPARTQVTATLTLRHGRRPGALQRRAPTSVSGRFATRVASRRRRRPAPPSACATGTPRGRWAYIVVKLPSGTLDATYNLTLAAPRTLAR